jgi:dolichol-phosphate mannosyltransferase
MKPVLVSGASGFVGANLVRRLLADGHRVHALVQSRRSGWRLTAIRNDVQLHQADVMDRDAVARVVTAARPAWVFHLAAYGAYSWQTEVRRIIDTNFLGTINMLDACLQNGVESFVNTGSSVEYGPKGHAPAETETAAPESHYAVAKLCATEYCRRAAQRSQARVSTLRLYSAYGPFEEPRRLIPTLVVSGLAGKLPPLVAADVARDFVYVDDVCDAYVEAAMQGPHEPGAVYNVGTGVQTTMGDAVEAVRQLLPIRADAHWGSMPNRSWDTSVWVCRNALIRSTLGWSPATPFADGLRETLQWFREQPDMLRRYRRALRRLPRPRGRRPG